MGPARRGCVAGRPVRRQVVQQTSFVLKTNICIAIGIKVIFFTLATVGVATLWMAVFADMGASLIVAANGLRLLRWKPPV